MTSLTATIGNLQAAFLDQAPWLLVGYALFILFACVVIPTYVKAAKPRVRHADAFTEARQARLAQLQASFAIQSPDTTDAHVMDVMRQQTPGVTRLRAGYQSFHFPTDRGAA